MWRCSISVVLVLRVRSRLGVRSFGLTRSIWASSLKLIIASLDMITILFFAHLSSTMSQSESLPREHQTQQLSTAMYPIWAYFQTLQASFQAFWAVLAMPPTWLVEKRTSRLVSLLCHSGHNNTYLEHCRGLQVLLWYDPSVPCSRFAVWHFNNVTTSHVDLWTTDNSKHTLFNCNLGLCHMNVDEGGSLWSWYDNFQLFWIYC